MGKETTIDSDHNIDAVRAEFEEWRSQRIGRGPIPKTLWAKAVSLLDRYPISTVSRELHLNAKRLSENRDGKPKIVRRLRNRTRSTVSDNLKPAPQFLQLTANQAASVVRPANPNPRRSEGPFQPSTSSIVIERADGSRLILRIPIDSTVIELLCSSFLRN